MREDEVIYVDLGLPSGRLWSKDFPRGDDGKPERIYYDKAALMNLPTREDVVELFTYCKQEFFQDSRRLLCRLLGPSGKCLLLSCASYDDNHVMQDSSFVFWLKGPRGRPLNFSLINNEFIYKESVLLNPYLLVT